MRGGVDSEDIVFVHGVLELWRYGAIYDAGMGSYPPRVALTLRAPANQRSANGIEVFTSCGLVPNRGTAVFIPGVSEL